MRFGNIPKTQSTAVFTFFDIPGEPWVRVQQSNEQNRPYYAAFLASQSKNRSRIAKNKFDAEMVSRAREVDRKLFPQHIDGGEWGGWIDEQTGSEAPHSPEAFRELMEQLPSYLFDDLRTFCADPLNFVSEDEPTADDIEETAGN